MGDDGVSGPHCFFNAAGDRVPHIGDEVLMCGMFSCADDGRENTNAEGYAMGESTGVAGASESPLG